MTTNQIVFSVFLASSMLLQGCVSVESLAGSPREPSCIGKMYKLKVDCYVVRPKWKEKTLVLSPDEAVYEGLPIPVNKINIGKSFQGDLIIDIMKRGAIFEVVDVKRLSSYEYDILRPYVRVTGGRTNNETLFQAYRLFSSDTGNLEIVPKYATEVRGQISE